MNGSVTRRYYDQARKGSLVIGIIAIASVFSALIPSTSGNAKEGGDQAASPELSGQPPPLSSPSLPPTNAQELRDRVEQLRVRYAPYMRSLPEALNVRDRMVLTNQWRAKFEIEKAASSNRPEPPAWFREDCDDSDWERVTVPEWRYAAEGPRRPVSCILWYRTRFAARPVKPGQRVFVVFGGVDWEAEVWLNGRFIGRHKVYCEPFRLDVTDTLKGENVLAVRVSAGPRFGEPIAYWAVLPDPRAREQRFVRDPERSIAGYQKGSPHLGSGFGIHREVFLETTGEASIAQVFARGDPATGTAKITLETDSIAARQLDHRLHPGLLRLPPREHPQRFRTQPVVSVLCVCGLEIQCHRPRPRAN